MPPSRRLPLAALGLAAGLLLFGWGLVHLFQLRFAAGDVYPPYSTLRHDPLGAAAFYDALDALPGLRAERNLRPLAELGRPRPAVRLGPAAPERGAEAAADADAPPACFYLGADPYRWPFLFTDEEADRLDAIVQAGGRVVLTFLPGQTPLTQRRLEHARGEDRPSPAPSASPARPPRRRPAREPELVDLIRRWNIDFRRDAPARPAAAQAGSAGPAGSENDPAVSWHSGLDFQLPAQPGSEWRALYRRGGEPVIAARTLGSKGGELLLASDSYFLSNEALRAEPDAALLARLVGPARRVLFDETHLGVAEQPGVMTLARRYHLQAALAALALWAALFVWRHGTSLVPPAPAGPDPEEGAGRGAAAGFLNLLRRSVPARGLAAACAERWEQSPPGGGKPLDAAARERLRAAAAENGAARRAPAAAYRAMCAALQAKR